MAQDISAPKYLNKEAKAIYNDLRTEINLTKTTGELLALLSQAAADYREVVEVVGREGKIVSTAAGGLKPHPAVAMSKLYAEQVCKIAGELCLTPKARAKLDLPDDAHDPLAKYGA